MPFLKKMKIKFDVYIYCFWSCLYLLFMPAPEPMEVYWIIGIGNTITINARSPATTSHFHHLCCNSWGRGSYKTKHMWSVCVPFPLSRPCHLKLLSTGVTCILTTDVHVLLWAGEHQVLWPVRIRWARTEEDQRQAIHGRLRCRPRCW
jgi:hypothetical protein